MFNNANTMTLSAVKIGTKHQVVIPNKLFSLLRLNIGDYLEAKTDGNRIILEPQQLIPKDQAWFWSKEWQEKTKEAEEDVAQGRVSEKFDTAESLISYLNQNDN